MVKELYMVVYNDTTVDHSGEITSFRGNIHFGIDLCAADSPQDVEAQFKRRGLNVERTSKIEDVLGEDGSRYSIELHKR